MKILSTLPFVLTTFGDIGIAADGTFASQAWRISDEAFNSIGGQKFAWIAPDGRNYMEHKDLFSRPTVEQIVEKITPALKAKAIEIGLIED